jgi:hypothetical protein
MTSVAQSELTERLGRVREAWPGGGWEWDGRFGCALAAVAKAHDPAAREAVAAGLSSSWTATTMAQAPLPLQQVCERTGGLRSDQLAFSAELDGGAVVYCLWWPWGGGNNFSARIGVAGPAELTTVLRAALSVK